MTLTLTFRSSDNLAAAFGIAVALTMLLTSILIYHVMREIWNWSLPLSLLVAGLFALVDLAFVSANLMKVFEGGWVPLAVAAGDLRPDVDLARRARPSRQETGTRHAAA